jgi:hypothetical protein
MGKVLPLCVLSLSPFLGASLDPCYFALDQKDSMGCTTVPYSVVRANVEHWQRWVPHAFSAPSLQGSEMRWGDCSHLQVSGYPLRVSSLPLGCHNSPYSLLLLLWVRKQFISVALTWGTVFPLVISLHPSHTLVCRPFTKHHLNYFNLHILSIFARIGLMQIVWSWGPKTTKSTIGIL